MHPDDFGGQLPPLPPPPAGPHPGEEAPALARAMAGELRGWYVALRQTGFTEHQALTMLGTFLGTIGKGQA